MARGRSWSTSATSRDPAPAAQRFPRSGAKPLEIHVPIKAGPRMIGVTFVQKHRSARREHGPPPHARPGNGTGDRDGDHQRPVRREQRLRRHTEPPPDFRVPSHRATGRNPLAPSAFSPRWNAAPTAVP